MLSHDTQLALSALPNFARVVIRMPNGPLLADFLTFCFDNKLVSVPVHPRTSESELSDLTERVQASLIVSVELDTLCVTSIEGSPLHEEARGLAFILFTSGSTGRPKGVRLSRSAVVGNAMKVANLHRFSPGRPHGTCLPLFHANALAMSLIGTHLTGTPMIFQERFSPSSYFAMLDASGARTASIVPALLRELMLVKPAWPNSLEYLITAAAPLSSDLAADFYQTYGPKLRQGYGMSEAVNFSFLMPSLNDREFIEQYVDNPPPVGLPLPGTEFCLRDGEVWVRSPDQMEGYWEDPISTSAALDHEGWLRTGDLGEMRDGFLVLRGRRMEMVNRGGEKSFPAEVEAHWRNLGLSGDFVAVPVAEKMLGQEFGLVIREGTLSRVRPIFENRKARPVVVKVGGLLSTETGKPRRRVMGEQLGAKRDSPEQYEEILEYAALTARRIIASSQKAECAQAAHMYNQAVALIHAHKPSGLEATYPRTAAHESFDALAEFWPEFAVGAIGGEELMHRHTGLWKRLMKEWPLVSYAELMAEVTKSGGFLNGRVLELGTGVGNTTALINGHVNGEFIWSDRVPQLVERGQWTGRGVVYDLDHDAPDDIGSFDTIMATNVLHCVADKHKTLMQLASLLKEGGRLILSEGASPTTADGTPWALDYLCSLWGGWWDRGGFRSRWEWMSMFEEAGLQPGGFSALLAGRHDLGGVVWATT